MEPRHDPTAFRAAMGLFGLSAGLALWALSGFVLGALGNPRLEYWLIATAVAYFVPALLLSGPMTMPRAVLWAAIPGLIAPALLVWTSLRFDPLEQMTDLPQPFVAFLLLVVFSLPYLVAAQRREPFNYIVLFNEAWRIVIRAVSTALFVGVFWGVYMMSNLLLSLVGIDLLDRLLDLAEFRFGMTGLVIGLALSVLYEQRAYLSPVLLMRLLQLLLIPVTGVVLVFVSRVPFQGLSEAFSGLSAAATLMAMTLGLASLVSAALDCEFVENRPSRVVLVTLRVASVLMPVLAFLATYAIWQRIDQYGWTPDRISAAILCLVSLAYALGYAVSVIDRVGWDQHMRKVNIVIGLAILALAAVSLTPLLNSQRISAQDQVARYQSGQSQAENLPLFQMANYWGIAGREALEVLEENAEPELARMIDGLRQDGPLVATREESTDAQRAALERLLPFRPAGTAPPEGFFEDLPPRYLADFLSACRIGIGRCAAVVSDQVDAYPGPEVHILVWTAFGDLQGFLVLREPRGDLSVRPLVTAATTNPEDILRQVLADEYAIAPPSMPALRVGAQEFIALPR